MRNCRRPLLLCAPFRALASALLYCALLWQAPMAYAQNLQAGIAAFEHRHYEFAYRIFKAEAGTDAEAQYYLGRMFAEGLGIKQNQQRAIRWYLKAADADHVDAQFALGELFTRGRDIGKNYHEAGRWLTKAAQNHHADAALRLGGFYLSGRGVDKNPSIGIAWLQQAQALGNEHAKEQLRQLQDQYPKEVFERASKQQQQLGIKRQGRHE